MLTSDASLAEAVGFALDEELGNHNAPFNPGSTVEVPPLLAWRSQPRAFLGGCGGEAR